MKYCVVLGLGPGEREMTRLRDLLASIALYEPGPCAGVVVVNDANKAGDEVKDIPFPAPIEVIPNPRQGRGSGWAGGLIVGLFCGYRHACARFSPDYFLKMDTDALVIRPFHERVCRVIDENPRAGMMGTLFHPFKGDNQFMGKYQAKKMKKLMLPIGLWRIPKWHLRYGWTARARRLAAYQRTARRNGYVDGESITGGAYVLTRPALEALERLGALDNPLDYVDLAACEDVVISMLMKAAGMDLLDLDDRERIFSIQLLQLWCSPPELLEGGWSIIHSVKDNGDCREKDTRAFFAAHRHG